MVKLFSLRSTKDKKQQQAQEEQLAKAVNVKVKTNRSNVVSSSSELSHIGKAAIKELEENHSQYHEKLWAKTSGGVVDNILSHTPRGTWTAQSDPEDGHSDWLPCDLADLLAKTEVWCDFVSLSPPDGMFLGKIKKALQSVYARSKETDKKIVIRFLFGNIVTVPVNCHAVIKELTDSIPTDSKLELWVGAWRKGMCWNHAKIVAVDGKEVYTGGHNLWDPVYLRKDPIHDTSIRLTGEVAVQAHLFVNEQWEFIRQKQSTVKGWIIDKISDGVFLPVVTRVTISQWPDAASMFAPSFHKDILPKDSTRGMDPLQIISLGRYGNIADNARSSDSAFIAMFDAAQKSIRLLLQDLGPVNTTVAGKRIVYKSWPKEYFKSWSKAMFERGVDIEIVLGNPGSQIEGVSYSNGWSCEEVAAEIIKTMKEQYPEASNDELKTKVKDNLRVCYLKNLSGNKWASKNNVGLHSKFFIVDGVCTYVGSQNLYLFDLAEWGIAIDDANMTAKIVDTLWNPMWKASYHDGCDCNEDRVMEILDVDRDPHGKATDEEIASMEAGIDLEKMRSSALYTDDDDKDCFACMIS